MGYPITATPSEEFSTFPNVPWNSQEDSVTLLVGLGLEA